MSVSIGPACINCDLCVLECPNTAIYRGDRHYKVDADLCSECVGFYDKPACMEVCPLNCIEHLPEKPEVLAI